MGFIGILLLCASVSAADDAVLLLHFYEGSGITTHDASGHGDDGVIYDAQWADGISGKALSFNSVTSYVGIPALGNMTVVFTVTAWVRIPYSNPQIILSVREGDDQYRPLLGASSGSSGQAAGSVNSDRIFIISVQDVDDGEWHQIAFSAGSVGSRSTMMNRYIDGSLSRELIDAFPIQVRTVPMYLGKGASEYYFHGLIDEVIRVPESLVS